MSQKKEIPFQIFKLAKDLQLRVSDDPVGAIFNHCDRQIETFLSDMEECTSLTEMLDWVAAKVGTIFKIVRSDADLNAVQKEFVNKGEKGFAKLDKDLAPEVFGITYRRQNALAWEPMFVSVIDCRGEKATRSYFTKWHEIAHLLTLTQQLRLVFRRTHNSLSGEDPEERLMDKIAARFGFYAPIFHRNVKSRISFSEIEKLRLKLCPEASSQASIINFVKYWPGPCLHIRAEMGLNSREKVELKQTAFDFHEQPEPVLRAVRVTANDKAKEIGFQLFDNMRVPEESIISRAFRDGNAQGEAVEDMSWWLGQASRPIKTETRLVSGAVEALIVPI